MFNLTMKGDPNVPKSERSNMTENQKAYDKEFHRLKKREPSSEDSDALGWGLGKLFGKKKYYVFKKELVTTITNKCKKHKVPHNEFLEAHPFADNVMLNHSGFCNFMAVATTLILSQTPPKGDPNQPKNQRTNMTVAQMRFDKEYHRVKEIGRNPYNVKYYFVSKSSIDLSIKRLCLASGVSPEIFQNEAPNDAEYDYLEFNDIMQRITTCLINEGLC